MVSRWCFFRVGGFVWVVLYECFFCVGGDVVWAWLSRSPSEILLGCERSQPRVSLLNEGHVIIRGFLLAVKQPSPRLPATSMSERRSGGGAPLFGLRWVPDSQLRPLRYLPNPQASPGGLADWWQPHTTPQHPGTSRTTTNSSRTTCVLFRRDRGSSGRHPF